MSLKNDKISSSQTTFCVRATRAQNVNRLSLAEFSLEVDDCVCVTWHESRNDGQLVTKSIVNKNE
jgi:hypothetical protein